VGVSVQIYFSRHWSGKSGSRGSLRRHFVRNGLGVQPAQKQGITACHKSLAIALLRLKTNFFRDPKLGGHLQFDFATFKSRMNALPTGLSIKLGSEVLFKQNN
jgi:hypothetical protein